MHHYRLRDLYKQRENISHATKRRFLKKKWETKIKERILRRKKKPKLSKSMITKKKTRGRYMMFLYGKLVPLELKDTVTVFPLKVYFQLQCTVDWESITFLSF